MSLIFPEMYNRYALSRKRERLIVQQYGSVDLYYQLRFNIAPTQLAPVVLVENGKLASRDMQWGFNPAWSKGPVMNAQLETLDKKTTWVNKRISSWNNDDAESARPLSATAESLAGAYALPAGLPEGATVPIRGFHEGFFDVEFEDKTVQVLSTCVRRNGW